jgi:hypothetical protein
MRNTLLFAASGCFLGLLALGLMVPAHLSDPPDVIEFDSSLPCDGEISVPVEISIDTPRGIAPGASIDLTGSVSLLADAPDLTLRFEGTGPVSVQAGPMAMGLRFAGETVRFEVSARYSDHGKAAIHVWAEARDELGVLLYSARETLYALIQPQGTLVGFGGFMDLELKALERDAATDALSAEEVEAARLELVRMVPMPGDDPLIPQPFTDRQRRLNALVGAPAGGYPFLTDSFTDAGTITVQGRIRWQDETGGWHPVYGGYVQIWDEDPVHNELVTVVATDAGGNYSATVNNDDGTLEGRRDIYVRYVTHNAWVSCMVTAGVCYYSRTGVRREVPDGAVIIDNFYFPAGGANDANSVFQAGTWIAAHVALDLEATALPHVDLVWPNGKSFSFYYRKIWIEQPDR